MENNENINNNQEQEQTNQNNENAQITPQQQTQNTQSQNEPLQARPYVQQEILPNSIGALVLGIISIVTCWCYGVIGLTLGIIGLVISNKGKRLYEENPENYTEGSYFIVGSLSGSSHSYDFYNFLKKT